VIRDAIRALRAPGGLVLYPTETLYGVGGRAGDALAAHRVAEAKGRGLQPLVVLVDEIPNDLEGLSLELAQEFWPGPLTLIVPAPDWVCPEVCAPDGSVGLRWSGHPVVSQLIQAVGPITSTSANLHGQPPPRSVGEVALAVDAIVDGGELPLAQASTLVHVASRRLLRRGALADVVERRLASG
jgi:L-threonylcarbamoyladenylate synthase